MTKNHALYPNILAVMLLLVVATANAAAPPANTSESSSMNPAAMHALLFEQNHGQFTDDVRYMARGAGFNFALTDHPVIELYRIEERPQSGAEGEAGIDQDRPLRRESFIADSTRIELRFPGASQDFVAEGLEPVQARTNYLLGSDSKHWLQNISHYQRIRYRNLYPGIDAEFHSDGALPEFDFVIHPGVDAQQIAMVFDGVKSLRVDKHGWLQIHTAKHSFRQRPPIAWQMHGERRHPVEVAYRLTDDGVGFAIGDYDADRPLVIDPVLEFSSYFGGEGIDGASGVHLDAAGNIYLIGTSTSTGLATPGAFRESNEPARGVSTATLHCTDCSDTPPGGTEVERKQLLSITRAVFASKFTPDGSQRLWTTYLREVDPVDAAFLNIGVNSTGVSATGEVAFGLDTTGPGLPLLNETQVYDPAQGNHYIAKLTSDGSGLVFATYLQAGTLPLQRGLDVSATGAVVAVGQAGLGNALPEANAIPGQNCTLNPDTGEFNDGYIVLFDPDGTLIFSSCLGGDTLGIDQLRGVRLGPDGRIFTVGRTRVTDFPLVNPIQSAPSLPGSTDMTISVIDPSTTPAALLFSTYFGPTMAGTAIQARNSGSPFIFPIDIAPDSNGNIIVTGVTNQLFYPTVNAWQPNLAMPRASYDLDLPFASAAQDIFLTRIDPVTPQVLFSTFLGGRGGEDGLHALALDPADNIYIATVTRSADYPTADAVQSELNGETDLGLTKFTPDGRLVWSTFFGGSDDQMLQIPGGIVVHPDTRQVIFAANTRSTDYPVLNPLQAANAGNFDAAIGILDQSGDVDTDGDGVPDATDAFPADATEWRDTDGNGVGDNADTDDDGDGVADAIDRFPLDALWSADADNDGIGDAADLFDGDPALAYDFDGDGIGDFADDDADGDGVSLEDAFPADPTRSADNDFDGIADPEDGDDDNDGIPDSEDPALFDDNIPLITFNGFDPFNTTNFKSPLPEGFATPDGAILWTAATDQSFSGLRSLSNLPVADNEIASVTLTQDFPALVLQFQYRVDSEENGDFLRFFIDGVEQLAASGLVDWTEFSVPLSAGQHTLEWRYIKNGSIASGDDAAWIDDIRTTPRADLSLTMRDCQDPALPGDSVEYGFHIVNDGPDPAPNVFLDGLLPAGFSLLESTPAGACTDNSGNINCAIGDVPAGTTADLGIRVAIDVGLTGTQTSIGFVVAGVQDPSGNNQANESTDLLADLVFIDGGEQCSP